MLSASIGVIALCKTNKMETILKITEISEIIFCLLDNKSLASMRLVNHASKRIFDNPSFWIRKLSHKYRQKFNNQDKIGINIAYWMELLKHSDDDPNISIEVALILMKIYYMDNGVESPKKIALNLVESAIVYNQIFKDSKSKEQEKISAGQAKVWIQNAQHLFGYNCYKTQDIRKLKKLIQYLPPKKFFISKQEADFDLIRLAFSCKTILSDEISAHKMTALFNC